ncbi:hypothetical protein HMPREF1544_02757 [Mucor circinelloides 1006PhL]|uniref:START domain-containing protein n=1 Tax=Mucor circinelloides f. circinelloides (strain 1006PhL) TaxID=1220926 RepID=S2JJE8_MUCC1|nr:hypothetical protein HMPREF1544_02757 [Mucor circinelloides 1006PhL]
MTAQNIHAETTRKALSDLKQLASSLEGWEFSQEKDGVKLYRKTVDSNPIAIVRGETDIVGHEFTPQQVASVATLPGCRKIWDEKYDTSEIKQMFSKVESLFWCKIKTPWPISPRDMAATSLREISEDECYVVMTSVEDDSIPAVSGCVRANLMISGWKIAKTDAGVHITYITQVDLAGSIPTAFVKNVQQQVPLCAGSVVKYVQEYGFAPTTTECTADFKSETFDHAKREYVCNLDGSGECKWMTSSKMYPNGVTVSIVGSSGNAKHEIQDAGKGQTIVVTGIQGPTTIKISKA